MKGLYRSREIKAKLRIPERYSVVVAQGERLSIIVFDGNVAVCVVPITKGMLSKVRKGIEEYEKGGKK